MEEKKYKHSATLGDLANISIGQGDLLLTPLQITSFYAAITNGGYVWRPYLVDHVKSSGKIILQNRPEILHRVRHVTKENLKLMKKVLFSSVDDSRSTGRKAKLAYTTVAGKTGSIQVVSLKKNRNRRKASRMKWQEHAMFAAFLPWSIQKLLF